MDSTAKQLLEAQRVAQIALEHHRHQDDDTTMDELDDATRHRDQLWLEHTWAQETP